MLESSTTETSHLTPDTEHRSAAPFNIWLMLRQFRTGIPVAELKRLADQTLINSIVTVFMSVMISALILLDSQQPGIIAWMLAQASLSAIVGWRARSRNAIYQASSDDSRLSRSGLCRAVGWAAISGVLWGALTLFMPGSSPEARIVIILTIGGMVAGGSTTLAAVPQVAIVFIAACAFPLLLFFLAQGTALGLMVALATIVFVAAMVGSTRIVHLSFRRQLDAEERSEHFRAVVLQHRIDSTVSEVRPLDEMLHDSIREVCHYSGWPSGCAYMPSSGAPSQKKAAAEWRPRDGCDFGAFEELNTPLVRAKCHALINNIRATKRPGWLPAGRDRDNAQMPRGNLLSQSSNGGEPLGADVALIVGVPVLIAREVGAVLIFVSQESRPPNRSRVELLATIGLHLGNTFERHNVIRQLQATEARARHEEARARKYLEIAGSVVIAIDSDERMTLLNRAGARLLECTESEALGQNWFDRFVPQAQRDARRAQFRRWMSGEEALKSEHEVQLQSASGKLSLVQSQMTLLQDDEGNIQGLLASGQDITEHRNTEAQLLQAQKMEAVGQLASGIAHDFNNALMAARGNLELLQQTTELDENAASLVMNSTSALDSAAALTSRLLSFSRKSILVTRPVKLETVVESIMQIVGRTFGRNINVSIQATPGLWLAEADATQLEASVLNLAINARDAMPEGGDLDIRLDNVRLNRTRAKEIGIKSGDYISIAVSDTGTGMNQSTLDRAFEPFFSAKQNHAGSGLGLSMVFGFAKQSNGAVTLSSAPGQGTTATIYLPRSQDWQQARKGSVAGSVKYDENSPSLRILVVDDEAPARDVTCLMLCQAGFNVFQANSAEQALELLHNGNTVDLVLTDILLGAGLNGYQLADRLLSTWPAMKIVFMSGYTDVAPEARGWQHSSLLRKPFGLRQLTAAVTGALQVANRLDAG